MWPTKTLQVRLGDTWYAVKYPFSRSMKQVLTSVFQGRDYPLCLPDDFVPTLILDVGSNVGAAAIWFHHRYPDARVICCEPSVSAFELLKENTLGIAQIEAMNFGLFHQDRQTQLHVGQYHVAQSSVVAHPETGPHTETISLKRASVWLESQLPDLIERISILKLDTEGCEVPILSDMRAWLERVDAIYVEYHSERDRREIERMLAEQFYLIRAVVQRANLGTLVYLSRSIADQHRQFVSPPLERPS